MSETAITRRSLLAAGVGALAGGVLSPRPALADLAAAGGPPRALLWSSPLGEVHPGRTVTAELARNADLVALGWRGGAPAGAWLRFATPGGGWSAWVAAGGRGHGPDLAATAAGADTGEPVWTGGTRVVQVRCERVASALELHLIDVSDGAGAAAAAGRRGLEAALELAQPMLAAGPGQPPIVARRAWARGSSPPQVAPAYGAVRMAFVHHTENPNGYTAGEVPAMLRAIYVFHRFVRGWNDIGYNFVVDLFGRIFEARAGGIDEAVVGAHAGGYNLVSTGVAVLGSFMEVPISAAARAALEHLLAWKLSLHGVPAQGRVTVRVNPAGASYSRFPANARVSLPRIAGHRDGDSTDCPGNVLYASLPAVRSSVAALAPRPVRLTLALEAGVLGGVLAYLDGTPVVGASVLVQSRTLARRGEAVSESTLAGATTDERGGWSAPGQYAPAAKAGLWVRALYAGGLAGAGATVSEGLHVAAQPPLISPTPAPSPTPAAPGPPAA